MSWRNKPRATYNLFLITKYPRVVAHAWECFWVRQCPQILANPFAFVNCVS
jgi:hypothetical protein